jgi:hypothetical protein
MKQSSRCAGARRGATHHLWATSCTGTRPHQALWKLSWFLRDFGYDTELLGRDEMDETQLVGLKGVVKISHIVVHGSSLIRLDGFASASRWDELCPANLDSPQVA